MKPYTAYTVRDYEGSDGKPAAEWLKIGNGFMHNDGYGVDVVLQAIPVDGRIVLRQNDKRGLELLGKWKAKE